MKKFNTWFAIPAVDFQRALKFYNAILGLEMEEVDCGIEKMACFPSGEGAISFSPGFIPSTDGVLVSLEVENDFDEVVSRIEKNGGKIFQPKTKIEAEGRGYFSLFIDTEGNKLSIHCSK